MGLDGGTIISRNDVLRGQCWDLSKADNSRSSRGGAVRGTFKRRKLDAHTSKVTRWTTCALSGQPLQPPVVACFLGNLYNKASVLEFLLARAGHCADDAAMHRYLNVIRTSGDAFDHITSTKDVFPLAYAPAAPVEVATDAAGAADPVLATPYTCPITSLCCDRHAFVALRPCGHVFAERAVREAARDGTCPTCGMAFSEEAEDVVPLLPSEEQLERLRELLPGRRKQGGKQRKKQKGEGKRQPREAEGEQEVADGQQQRQQEAERQQEVLQRQQQQSYQQQRPNKALN